MKCTCRNKMAGCLARHNDRDFDLSKAPHIDVSRMHNNILYNIYNDSSMSFRDVEKRYYEEHYRARLDKMNEKAKAAGHRERIQTMNTFMKKHLPEEVLIQIGGMHDNIDPDIFKSCVNEFIKDMQERGGDNCHILDYAIHFDEATPHCHIRRVWDFINDEGDLEPGKNGAMKELGIELPDPNAPESRNNYRGMIYDSQTRERWIDIAEEHGFTITRATEKELAERQNADYSRPNYSIKEYKEHMADLDQRQHEFMENSTRELEEEAERLRKENEKIELENKAHQEQLQKEIDAQKQKQEQLAAAILSAENKLLDMSLELERKRKQLKDLDKEKEAVLKRIKKELPRKDRKAIETSFGIREKDQKEIGTD